MSHMKLENIGTLRLSKPQVFRETFETASWYRDIEVPPGEYPMDLSLNPEGLPQFVLVGLPGTCVGSLFVNRVLWEHSSEKDKDVGKPFTYHLQTYPGHVVQAFLAGTELHGEGSGITVALDIEKVCAREYNVNSVDAQGNPVQRPTIAMDFVRPIQELLREQMDANRVPLTEPHQLVYQVAFGSLGNQHVVRIHAVEDGYKIVTTNNDHEPFARVTGSEAVASFEEVRAKAEAAMGWHLTLSPGHRAYHLRQLDEALDAWAAGQAPAPGMTR